MDKLKIKTKTMSVRLELTRSSNGESMSAKLNLLCVLDWALTDPAFNNVDLNIVRYLYSRDCMEYLITLVSKFFEKAEI